MILYLLNLSRGQWHKLWGHPMDAVRVEDNQYVPGRHPVKFTCEKCGRSFKKQVCGTCNR